MMDEEEIHRKELTRLLSTAKDQNRQDLILKAIHALDEQESVVESRSKPNFMGMSPSIHASLFLGENMPSLESVTLTPGGSSRMRPMSARRRPSVPNLMDAIPELQPNRHLVNRNEEIVMPLEDIAEVVASSFDRRFPPKNIFRQTIKSSDFNSIAGTEGHTNHSFEGSSHLTPSSSGSNIGTIHNLGSSANGNLVLHSPSHSALHSPSHSSGLVMPVAHRMIGKGGSYKDKAAVKGWICSGVVPQFVHVVFFEKWEIKKIEVFCSGIEKLCVQINASASSALKGNTATMTDMVHMGKGAFVWTLGGTEDTFDRQVGGLPGISVTFTIKATSNIFIHISEIRIIVHPYT